MALYDRQVSSHVTVFRFSSYVFAVVRAFRVYMCLCLSRGRIFRDTELNAFICVSHVNISPGYLTVIDGFISLPGLRRVNMGIFAICKVIPLYFSLTRSLT